MAKGKGMSSKKLYDIQKKRAQKDTKSKGHYDSLDYEEGRKQSAGDKKRKRKGALN